MENEQNVYPEEMRQRRKELAENREFFKKQLRIVEEAIQQMDDLYAQSLCPFQVGDIVEKIGRNRGKWRIESVRASKRFDPLDTWFDPLNADYEIVVALMRKDGSIGNFTRVFKDLDAKLIKPLKADI